MVAPIWGGDAPTVVKPLQTSPNKILRTAGRAPWFIFSNRLHKEFDLLTIAQFISYLSKRIYETLPSSPATYKFLLEKSYSENIIQSRFSKDLFKPP